jgi:YD repeat-containing protein
MIDGSGVFVTCDSLTSVVDASSRVTAYQYDRRGALTRVEHPGNVVQTRVHDGRGMR